MLKMRFLLLLILYPALVSAIANYKAGDKLFVLSTSGLALREKPDPAGAKMQTLKNGAPVVVEKEDLKKFAYTVNEFKGYDLEGYWVKIKTWDNKIGYVFDAYLSKYQAPAKVILKDHIDPKYTVAEQYMMVHSKPKGKRVKLAKTKSGLEHYTQAFVNGAVVEVDKGKDNTTFKIKFDRSTTTEEAYLIGKALWLEGLPAQSMFIDGLILLTNQKETKQATIELKNKVVILTMMIAD